MSETSIIMAVIGFIFGSFQYQVRIRLQDTKESMYRVIKYYKGTAGEGASIFKILELMRKGLITTDKGNEEYKKCVKEWDNAHFSLYFWGMIFPLILLVLYIVYKNILLLY